MINEWVMGRNKREVTMKSKFLIQFALSMSMLLLPLQGSPRFIDRYSSFEELKRVEREGIDFRIRKVIRNSDFSIFAIHGGQIEPQTTEVAELLAGNQWSFYSFEGIKKTVQENAVLHLTSSHFDEPQALDLAISSRICVSIHSYLKDDQDEVCVGGGNLPLKEYFLKKGGEEMLPILFKDCTRFPGKNHKNIINRCNEKGVQLELSTSLCKKIKKNQLLKVQLVSMIRKCLNQFLLSLKPKNID